MMETSLLAVGSYRESDDERCLWNKTFCKKMNVIQGDPRLHEIHRQKERKIHMGFEFATKCIYGNGKD